MAIRGCIFALCCQPTSVLCLHLPASVGLARTLVASTLASCAGAERRDGTKEIVNPLSCTCNHLFSAALFAPAAASKRWSTMSPASTGTCHLFSAALPHAAAAQPKRRPTLSPAPAFHLFSAALPPAVAGTSARTGRRFGAPGRPGRNSNTERCLRQFKICP